MMNLRHLTLAGTALLACLALTFCGGATGPVSITTTTLPDGVLNQPYNQQVQGKNVNSWFIVNDTQLPPGLAMNTAGVISGIPTATGTFVFTVEADQSSAYGSPSVDQTLVITITPS